MLMHLLYLPVGLVCQIELRALVLLMRIIGKCMCVCVQSTQYKNFTIELKHVQNPPAESVHYFKYTHCC